MNKIASLAILAGGVVLIVLGVNATNSFGSDVSRFFTGSPTDKAVWMLIAGIVVAGIGLAGTLRGSKAGVIDPMKTLFTAEAISKGGRSGSIETPDGLLNVTLGNPLQKGIEKRGPNPELFFAAAYSACYHGAVMNAAKKLGTPVEDSTVRALVSLIEDGQGGFRLAVELHAQLPGIDPDQSKIIMETAHKTCPYSKALRGDTSVKLVLDADHLVTHDSALPL